MGTSQDLPQLDDGTKKAINRLARDLREDALQEAYLAALQGKDPKQAVREFGRREQNRRRRVQVGLRHDPARDDTPYCQVDDAHRDPNEGEPQE